MIGQGRRNLAKPVNLKLCGGNAMGWNSWTPGACSPQWWYNDIRYQREKSSIHWYSSTDKLRVLQHSISTSAEISNWEICVAFIMGIVYGI